MVDLILNAMAKRKIPERVTHNDTKFNNVMLDVLTGEAMCVVDLDTVMPGCALYDFGDMVRSATNSAAEDERDLSRVHARLPIFAALVEGCKLPHVAAVGVGGLDLTEVLGDVEPLAPRPGRLAERRVGLCKEGEVKRWPGRGRCGRHRDQCQQQRQATTH